MTAGSAREDENHENRLVRIVDLVGPQGLRAEDGRRLYDQLHPALLGGETVELDFAEIEELSEPFLDAAIGRLLEDIPYEDILARLVVCNVTVRHLQGVRWVLEHARDEGPPATF
ncbi:hypothetical protein DSECCO2_593160 [anaerobic digester metagenome]